MRRIKEFGTLPAQYTAREKSKSRQRTMGWTLESILFPLIECP